MLISQQSVDQFSNTQTQMHDEFLTGVYHNWTTDYWYVQFYMYCMGNEL